MESRTNFIMRTFTAFTLICAAALTAAGCTVKDIDAPALAGPSTLAHSIQMTADRDTLTQNGVDFVDIRLASIGPNGQSESIPLWAQVYVDGVPQDYGTLSNKQPITPTTIRYTAPAGSTLAAGQVAQTISIVFTPSSSGDFRSELSRQIDLRLVPQGVILPTNPNLVAAFTINPAAPQVLSSVSFDAGTTTNNGTACGISCTYAWDFGDGTSSSGVSVVHTYRTVGSFVATLTVTDARGAQTTATKSVVIAPGTPPTPNFTFSPTPAVVEQAIFFNASESLAAPGRTIVSYEWDFGKGTTGSGVSVSKTYETAGTYTVTLKVTDDAGSSATKSLQVAVNSAQIVPNFTVLPAAPVINESVIVNATSSTSTSPIVSYIWSFGAGSNPATGSGVTASTQYTTAGSKVITLTVTDSQGRTASSTKVVSVSP